MEDTSIKAGGGCLYENGFTVGDFHARIGGVAVTWWIIDVERGSGGGYGLGEPD